MKEKGLIKKHLLFIGVVIIFFVGTICYFKVFNVSDNKQEVSTIEGKYYQLKKDGTIYFKDSHLENKIKKITGLKKIYPSDALKYDTLILENADITSLGGIEFFQNLNYLSLEYNEISDISYVGKITSLKFLNLSDNNIKDIFNLSSLINLECLYLNSNNITDAFPLLNLTKLRFFPSLENNGVINLDVLEKNIELYYENNKKNYYEIKIISDTEVEYVTDFSKNNLSGCIETYEYCMATNFFQTNLMEMSSYKKGIKVAKEFIKKNITNDMKDVEKEVIIMKYLMDILEYYNGEQSIDEKTSSYYHDYYYMFVLHQSFNYAEAFSLLGRLAGLEVNIVSLNYDDYKDSVDYIYDWNVVKIDDNYYYVDLTYADLYRNDKEYIQSGLEDFWMSYINISKNKMSTLHKLSYPNYTYTLNDGITNDSDMDRKLLKKYFDSIK